MNKDIETFAIIMDSIYQKRHKQKGDSWKTIDINLLEAKLLEEKDEYLESHNKNELVDMALCCMMLYMRKS